MPILTQKVFFDAMTSAETTPWYALDYRRDKGGTTRSIEGTLTAGDTIYVESTNEALYDAANASATTPTVIVTIGSFTTSPFSALIEGPQVGLRIRKSGTTGPATVIGVI